MAKANKPVKRKNATRGKAKNDAQAKRKSVEKSAKFAGIETAASVSRLAKSLGVTEGAVWKWKRRSDWVWPVGPYPIETIRAWRAKTFKVDQATVQETKKLSGVELDEQLKQAKIDEINQKIAIKAGEYTKTDVVLLMMREMAQMMLSPLEEMVKSIPPQAQGLPAPSIERLLDERVQKIRDRLTSKIHAAAARAGGQ